MTYRDRESFRTIVAADQVDFARYLGDRGLIQARRAGLLAGAGRGRGLWVWIAVQGLILVLVLVWASRSSRRSAARIALPLLCVAGGLVFLAMTFAFPVVEEAGPELVPRLWIGLLTLVGLSIAWTESRRRPTDSEPDRRHLLQVLRFSILLGLYLGMLPWIGYLVTTGLFLVTAMVMLGERRPVTVLGVPLLTLGIPGSASMAVLIGALMIHDLVPGPRLFEERPDLIYGIFASLFVANGVMLAVGLLGSRVWVKVTAIPKRVLFPLIMAVSVVGSLAVRSSTFDVVACLAFGVLGWFMRRHQYPVAPVVLGLVLGNIMETNFRRAVLMDGYGVFLERPVSAIVLGVALLSFAIPLSRQWRAARG